MGVCEHMHAFVEAIVTLAIIWMTWNWPKTSVRK